MRDELSHDEAKQIIETLDSDQLLLYTKMSEGINRLAKELTEAVEVMETQNEAIERAGDLITEYKMLKFDRDCLADEVAELRRRLGDA